MASDKTVLYGGLAVAGIVAAYFIFKPKTAAGNQTGSGDAGGSGGGNGKLPQGYTKSYGDNSGQKSSTSSSSDGKSDLQKGTDTVAKEAKAYTDCMAQSTNADGSTDWVKFTLCMTSKQ